MASPHSTKRLPSEREVSEHRDFVTGVGRRGGMSDVDIEALVTEFSEQPREWILKPIPFGFDHLDRLWVATTRDRTAFSYFDIWTGTEYTGSVRIQGRLLSFDIMGTTLVALVEWSLTERAVDWYDLNSMGDIVPSVEAKRRIERFLSTHPRQPSQYPNDDHENMPVIASVGIGVTGHPRFHRSGHLKLHTSKGGRQRR